VNNWDGCEIRVSGIIPLGLGRTGMQTTEIRRLQDNLKTPPSQRTLPYINEFSEKSLL